MLKHSKTVVLGSSRKGKE